jgi:hypothetical protein
MSGHKDAWDYIVLDEAQIIKNAKTKVAANVRTIAEAGVQTRRLILSGTPIMNNLSELWALMDFACSGKILGPELRLVLKILAGNSSRVGTNTGCVYHHDTVSRIVFNGQSKQHEIRLQPNSR